ncbi:ABC transporter substrate-binding protein [Tistlia consotensis]|nr:ABC transporter substrate-binding protein [Tistlia consotensis]
MALTGSVFAVALAAGGWLAQTGGIIASAEAAGSDTLVIARDMDLDSLDPARAFCDTCQIYISSVYQRLVDLAPDNKTIVPALATKWEINADQTQFTFHLDPKATFSDGSPVEAKDVKWSWLRLKHMKSGPSFMMDGVTAIETPDAHTVVVKLDAPNSEFLGVLTAPYTGVTNSDVAMQHGANDSDKADSTDTAESWFLQNSAGGGPFVLESYRPNDELRLKRNDNYWGKKAAVGEIVIKQTKDAVSQAQMLESGAADIAMQIDPDTAKNISSGDVVIKTVPSFNFVYVAVSPGAKNLPVKLTPKVREAIGYAIDYEGTINLTLGGDGNLQPAPIPNGFPGTDNLPMPVHDVAKAEALLKEAGVADGFTLDAYFPNINVYGVDLSTMMQKVQQDLSKVKIKLNLNPVTFSVWREHINGDGIPVTAVFYAPDYYGSGQYVQYFAMMKGTAWSKRAGAANDPSVLNPKEGDLLAKALAASGDKRDGYFHEIALEIIKDRVIIPVVSPQLVLAYRKNVEGVRYSACCNLPTAELSLK